MTMLHLDYWTADATALDVFIISPGPVEEAYTVTVETGRWVSVDIPISEFHRCRFRRYFSNEICRQWHSLYR